MTGKTERLHYDDPLRLDAEARVLAHGRWQDRPSVVLDRTPFYPESGGQLGDTGALGEARVVDVQLDDTGAVHHLVEGPLPPVGATVRGVVDGARRRAHMALHTGQHALSRALLDELGAVTVSSRLGASACTVDVDLDGLTLDDVRRAEDVVNRLIDEDRPVRQRFVDDDELERLELRKPPPDADRIRVVEIEGFDVTPCGGTHATHTAQVELCFVDRVERYKGGTRITFAAGPRARRALQEESDGLRAVAAELGCAPPEVGDIVGALRTKLDDARTEAGALRARLAEAWARQLEGRADSGRVVATLEGADPSMLKAIAQRVASGSRLVVLTAPTEGGTHLLVARGPDGDAHAGQLLQRIAAAKGGRGGGRPELAQGRLPAGVSVGLDDLE